MRTSNYTLQSLEDAAEEKVDYIITSESVVRAANHIVKIYKKHERRAKGQHRYETISFGAAGYALNLIGLGNLTAWVTATVYAVGDVRKEDDVGHVCVEAHTSGVFIDDLASGKWEVFFPLETEETMRIFLGNAAGQFNRIDEVIKVKNRDRFLQGYFIENDTVFRTPDAVTSVTYVVEYDEAPVLFSTAKIDMNQFLPIDKNAEEIFEEFALEKFFRRKSLGLLSREAEARYLERLTAFFGDKDHKAVFL